MSSSCASALIVIATILGPITMVFMAVSFGTDYWLRFNVDRDALVQDDMAPEHARYTHTRYRGLFRECYPGKDTAFLDDDPNVIDDFCYKVNYDMPDRMSDKSEEFLTRIHLLRLFLAFFVIALVFFVAAFVFGMILCCWRLSRWAYIASILAFISAFSVAAAIAFFHGAEYLERNKLSDDGFYLQWSTSIQEATSRRYDWSYALGWVGMILAAITATFYALAGCYLSAARYEDRERLEKESHRSGRDYPMYVMDDPYMMKPQPFYANEYPYAYPGPYLMAASETPRYLMTEPAPNPAPREVWNLREVPG